MKLRDVDFVEQDIFPKTKKMTKKPLKDSERKKENVRQARRNKSNQRWS